MIPALGTYGSFVCEIPMRDTAEIDQVPSVAWFVVVHCLLGSIAGALCACILLILDIAHLRSLLSTSDMMVPGLVMLFGGFMVTFGGVICATAVMQISNKPVA